MRIGMMHFQRRLSPEALPAAMTLITK
jgi:hypothetical protein